ncbi:Class E vacuolar protein-sorting machinery protein hse1 [Lachnellula arida]|uniref:Class E vacuolar protein-sorting machinery protein HSE1 n=2 Tax=Lachnellula TaxID=47830 RepID=A0A8T9BLP1_9HELO|nr:Class E vacuolar protein-sorting machinery protein hse1 [Lachnellula arida]
MFRAQQNAFDDVVAKATDENLTSENWEYIMDVCDKVTTEDSGAKDAVASMIKRLAHRNANVQLYTLELANALSQNCGVKMHRELASRAFTDALLRLANDRNTHQQVKAKILERMQEWAEMFKDPDLGIMRDQYQRLKSQNPNLHPPSAPSKSRLTDVDRQKEEDELQMALKLSIQDKATQAQAKSSQQQPSSSGPSQSQPAPQPQIVPSGTTAATVSRVRALFDFQATDPDELTFRKGDIIAVLESVYKDWWKGFLRGQTGIFPLNYVEKLADPTPDELHREAQMEAEVFAEIKNVEKLLTLLSTSTSDLNVRDNDEITKLYHSTLAIRPKLIELIGKYSQRKDDFTQLNERFIKSCRDYENLLDASMTQAQPAYQYGRQNQPYGGGYPPQAAPPQSEPQRYYTPNPQDQPYPQQPSSPQGYPPQPLRTGPQPFYVVGQNQQHPQPPPPSSEPQGNQPYPQRDPTPRIPSASKPTPLQTTASPPPNQYPPHQTQSNQRPQSIYSNNPKSLLPLYTTLPASVYSEEEPYSTGAIGNQQPPPSQQQYSAYAPAPLNPHHHPQPQPGYQPPAPPASHIPPVGTNPGYPAIDSRQTLPGQGAPPPPQGQYKAYQRPGSSDGTAPSAPSAPSAPPRGPADFYRQSAAY